MLALQDSDAANMLAAQACASELWQAYRAGALGADARSALWQIKSRHAKAAGANRVPTNTEVICQLNQQLGSQAASPPHAPHTQGGRTRHERGVGGGDNDGPRKVPGGMHLLSHLNDCRKELHRL